MYRVQVFDKPSRWIDHALPGCEPDRWADLTDAVRFAQDFMLRHQGRKAARVVKDENSEPVWPVSERAPVAAFDCVNDVLERLCGPRRHDDCGFGYRGPDSWRPVSLYGMAHAELTPHGFDVSLKGRDISIRHAGQRTATAGGVFAVCQRLNWLYGQGEALRAEFTGPGYGHVIVKPHGLVERRLPFTLLTRNGKPFVRFRGHIRRLPSPGELPGSRPHDGTASVRTRPVLKCETNTGAASQEVEAAFQASPHGTTHYQIRTDFEHDRWWVTCLDCGAQWSVNDGAGGDTAGGFDFEEVSCGEDYCLAQSHDRKNRP